MSRYVSPFVRHGIPPACTRRVGADGIMPDNFATGGDLGFTIATPVYDNSSDPPAFLGVTAIDFKVQVGFCLHRRHRSYPHEVAVVAAAG